MTFVIKFTPQAEEDLSRLDKTIAQNIANKIEWLSQNIENIISAPLRGKFKGKYIPSSPSLLKSSPLKERP